MNFTLRLVAALALTVILAGIAPMAAHAAKPNGTKATRHVSGVVTDISPNSITIFQKKLNVDLAVSVTDGTKYVQNKSVGLSGLAVGDKVRAEGANDLAPGTTTITATHIEIVSPLAAAKKLAGSRVLEGTVTSVTPSITLNSDDGTAYTVLTTPTTTVIESMPAVLADIVVGKHVKIAGTTIGASFVASEVTVAASKAGHSKKNNALDL